MAKDLKSLKYRKFTAKKSLWAQLYAPYSDFTTEMFGSWLNVFQ